MRVQVRVRLKSDVRDPQGEAIAHALGALGFEGVQDVRVGKLIELELKDSSEVEAMCQKLLANPVLETFEVVSL